MLRPISAVWPYHVIFLNFIDDQWIVYTFSIHYTMNQRNVPPTPSDPPIAFSSDSTCSTVTASPISTATSNSTSSTAPNSPITNNQQLPTANNAISHATNPPVSHDKRYPCTAHASNVPSAPMDQARLRSVQNFFSSNSSEELPENNHNSLYHLQRGKA